MSTKSRRRQAAKRSKAEQATPRTMPAPSETGAAPPALPAVTRARSDRRAAVSLVVSTGALFVITRVFNLTLAGLHYDEATYLYWGQVIASDWSQRYIGAAWGGKQPLHAWLVALSERILADPVFAGRLVSVTAGALAVIAVWLIARRLFSGTVAQLAVLLYIICPFTLIFDRLALIDSLLTMEAAWFIYFGIRLADRQEVGAAAGLAVAFGAALLTKSVGEAFPLLLPASLLALDPRELNRARFARWLIAAGAALIGGFAIYYVAFGSSDAAKLIGQFEQQYGKYTLSPSELLGLPWAKWQANAMSVVGWFAQFVGAPLSLLALAALASLPWLGRRAWLLAAWAVLPIMGQVLVANVFYERYILFSIPPLLILCARFVEWAYTRLGAWKVWARGAALAALGLLLLPPLVYDWGLLTDVPTANRASSGFYGLYALRDYVTTRAALNPVVVVVNYSPAPIEDGSAVLLRNARDVQVLRVAPASGGLTIFDPATGQIYPAQSFANQEVYYANSQDAETNSWLSGHLELAARFPNLRGDDTYVALYHIHFDASFR